MKKSAPASTSMCDRMNSFQVVMRLRSGAGAMLCRRRILPTVWSVTSWPRLASAPAIRSYPSYGFHARIGPPALPLRLGCEDDPNSCDGGNRRTCGRSGVGTRPGWVRLGHPRDVVQRLPSESFGDLGQRRSLSIRQAEPVREMGSENAILSNQVLGYTATTPDSPVQSQRPAGVPRGIDRAWLNVHHRRHPLAATVSWVARVDHTG